MKRKRTGSPSEEEYKIIEEPVNHDIVAIVKTQRRPRKSEAFRGLDGEEGLGKLRKAFDAMKEDIKKRFQKTILVTGAGTLGTAIVNALYRLHEGTDILKEIRVIDNSEEALWNLEEEVKPDLLKLFIGDIRDKDRMMLAMRDVHVVYHTAALKHVRFTNYNPIEAVETNVNALSRMLQIAIESPTIEVFCNMSTDKACSPNNVYGETKLIGERLTTWAWKVSGKRFFSARSGNFIGSRGSVLARWRVHHYDGIALTDPNMNRFFIKPDEVAEYLVRMSRNEDVGGKIVTPFCKVLNMGVMADIVAKEYRKKVKIVGAGEGEKQDEMLINYEEAQRTVQTDEDGWWTYPDKVENAVKGAISTAVVPSLSDAETEKYLEELI